MSIGIGAGGTRKEGLTVGALVDLGLVGLVLVGLKLVGVALVGLLLVGLVLVGRVVVGLPLVGLKLVGLVLVGQILVGLAVVGVTLVGLALVGLALVEMMAVGAVVDPRNIFCVVGAGEGGTKGSTEMSIARSSSSGVIILLPVAPSRRAVLVAEFLLFFWK